MRTTMRYPLTPIRMAVQVLVRMCRKWDPPPLLVGMKNGAAVMENTGGSSRNVTYDPGIQLLGTYAPGTESKVSKTRLHPSVDYSTVQNSYNMGSARAIHRQADA